MKNIIMYYFMSIYFPHLHGYQNHDCQLCLTLIHHILCWGCMYGRAWILQLSLVLAGKRRSMQGPFCYLWRISRPSTCDNLAHYFKPHDLKLLPLPLSPSPIQVGVFGPIKDFHHQETLPATRHQLSLRKEPVGNFANGRPLFFWGLQPTFASQVLVLPQPN